MPIPQSIVNTNASAPRFATSENVAREKMSSFDLLELVNSARAEFGESEVRRNDFTARCRDELDGEYYETFVVRNQRGPASEGLMLTKDQCLLVSMRESKAVRRSVVAKINALEAPELSTIQILQIAMESEKARLMLTAQVEQQATKIHSLENLFKEGMTHTQFCKGLNGVNVMQVGNYLESRSWLYNESKSGVRHRVGSYARDKYMTEHQVEVTPHGKDPFISYTPILLKKGATRLYDLYLAGELPMKKTWDGLFTHDKAVRGAA
ncbi:MULTISPECIES: phage antirepressor protein [unclassified Pseudomonas]|uniref:phage antirepressor protein n=2 Tax=unclassified Pseudomonas TaxID=196821 RepID=UPI000C88D1D1|nr:MULTISPECIES: phage antirepressor protein [unclassified Pseudomonas]PMX22742.1 phage antirepressor protein [Pseudomonas sp. GW460-12]PMX39025.1 phage antirepressor protein [Pseudomonas sp. MPR-R2A7]PMX51768.1 phage antirepressor protein [Pseudomonas sp. MPR-R2A6]PNA42445.1 phage antirepressor protein [Pseudomonas sp. MPR-LB5]PMX31774.1 phage antirepressor protein [Pseudomonas sp. MPR-R2A4]